MFEKLTIDTMQTLVFEPILKRIRWGGRRLGSVLGKPLGDAEDYAESWEISDHGHDQSIVVDGELAGWSLHRLIAEHAEALLGRHAGLSQFPLLIKFLDAHDRLSVQVHPDDARAKQIDPVENGKTEAWVIVDAEPGSRIYAGLKPHVDRTTLEVALRDASLADCLHSFTPRVGDCVFIPAGTVHAIGEGILLAEVQQSSDLTFRLYDWGRLGSDGQPRQLHIAEALDCIDFDRGPISPQTPRVIESHTNTVEELVRCDYFVLHRTTLRETLSFSPDERFHVLMVLDGNGVLDDGSGPLELRRGQTLILPAERSKTRLAPADTITLLDIFLP